MNRTNIRHWHSTHNDALRALSFYKDEIAILTGRLEEVAAKNTGQQVSAEVEHFQNQFILHSELIDGLKHDINVSIAAIGADAQSQTGFIDNDVLEKLATENQRYVEEEKLIHELRYSFNRFCQEWM